MSEPSISVLFVDDELPVLRAIKRSLDGAPFAVLTAHGPAEALRILASRPVDVLVADADMPDMTGLELLQIARRDHPVTTRMLLTGCATLDKAMRAINDGQVQRIYEKPFESVVFIEDIEALSGRIAQLRAEAEGEQRRAYLAKLAEWVEALCPTALEIPRNAEGEVTIDVLSLAADFDDSLLPGIAHNLLRADL